MKRIRLVGHAHAHRDRRRNRKLWTEHGKPALLFEDQFLRHASAGEPQREVLPEANHDVVPAGLVHAHGKVGEVWVLGSKQAAEESLVDLHLSGRGGGSHGTRW
ncbi:MAG: hypothetical protein AAGG01_02815 [Planctomycetota bacterium]